MNLTKRFIETAPVGYHRDDQCSGLYLKVRPTTKSFVFRRMVSGKQKEISLGSVKKITLPVARSKADSLRALDGESFLAEVEKKKKPSEGTKIEVVLFKDAARGFEKWSIESGKWQELNKSHKLYLGRLKNHIFPILGERDIETITPNDIAEVLSRKWKSPQLVKKLRGLLKQIFDWSSAKGFFHHDNPASITGPLKYLLPSEKAITKNRGALSVEDLPSFMKALHEHLNGASFCCGFFAILTATRSGTARRARWEQINFEKKEWTIPPDQLKVSENGYLIVPLAPEVIDFLKSLEPQEEGLIFTNSKGRILSDTIFSRVPLEVPGNWQDKEQSLIHNKNVRATMHGIARATFRTWAQDDRLGNDNKYDPRVAELCLHHKVDDGYGGAYERNKSFLRRREMMEDWAKYCFSEIEGRSS